VTNVNSVRAAKAISFAFNPLFVAAPTFLALLFSEKASGLPELFLIALIFGTVLPIVVLCLLVQRGRIPDLYVSDRERRPVAFAPVMASYLSGAILLLLCHAPSVVTAVMLCYLGNSLVMTLVSVKWKISVHASGIAGPVTALTCSFGVAALCLLGLAIPIGWARVRLGAHSVSQVVAGILLTIAATWLQLRVYLTLL
jgi:membrane-associated phospholipid phosphatase